MKSETLKVALLQADLVWEDAAQNKLYFEEQITHLPEDIQLIILPEMFTTGFSMNPEPLAEFMSGDTIIWLQQQALKAQSAICGSLIITENGHYYNRFIFMYPDSTLNYYNKRHTFNMAGEGEHYQAGTSPVLINYLGWKIFPQICYDLRFPVFARNTCDYDLLIYVANWPKTRINAWDTLLKARAIENMSYCLGVNRVGTDGNRLEYTGHSAIYDLLGEDVVNCGEEAGVGVATLSKTHITETREKLPFLNDKDAFTLL